LLYPAFRAVDPIRRSRSSNGTGVSHGLRAAEGNSRTSCWIWISLKGESSPQSPIALLCLPKTVGRPRRGPTLVDPRFATENPPSPIAQRAFKSPDLNGYRHVSDVREGGGSEPNLPLAHARPPASEAAVWTFSPTGLIAGGTSLFR
jgi:hypothetical protein